MQAQRTGIKSAVFIFLPGRGLVHVSEIRGFKIFEQLQTQSRQILDFQVKSTFG